MFSLEAVAYYQPTQQEHSKGGIFSVPVVSVCGCMCMFVNTRTVWDYHEIFMGAGCGQVLRRVIL